MYVSDSKILESLKGQIACLHKYMLIFTLPVLPECIKASNITCQVHPYVSNPLMMLSMQHFDILACSIRTP